MESTNRAFEGDLSPDAFDAEDVRGGASSVTVGVDGVGSASASGSGATVAARGATLSATNDADGVEVKGKAAGNSFGGRASKPKTKRPRRPKP